jgi:hypothetical protein
LTHLCIEYVKAEIRADAFSMAAARRVSATGGGGAPIHFRRRRPQMFGGAPARRHYTNFFGEYTYRE